MYHDELDGVPVGAASLYVPKNAIKAYSSVYGWKDFGNIRDVAEVVDGGKQ